MACKDKILNNFMALLNSSSSTHSVNDDHCSRKKLRPNHPSDDQNLFSKPAEIEQRTLESEKNYNAEEILNKSEKKNYHHKKSNLKRSASDFDERVPKRLCKNDKIIESPADWLNSLLNREPKDMLHTLANSLSGLEQILGQKQIPADVLHLLVQLARKVVETDSEELKNQTLCAIFSYEFIDKIKHLVLNNDEQTYEITDTFIDDLLIVFNSIINLIPTIMNKHLKSLFLALDLSIKDNKFDKVKFYQEQLTSLRNQLTSYMDTTPCARAKPPIVTNYEASKTNFRDIPLTPTIDDFSSNKIILQPNIIKGSYRDVEHYLDIHFKLLREDFIASLRRGIFEYIDSLHFPCKKQKYTNVKIYSGVKFVECLKEENSFGYRVSFTKEKRLKNQNWECNKRFMFGSLLLFSDDDFKTFFMATVMNRNINQLKLGKIDVSFIPGSTVPEHVFQTGLSFVMAESEVYYEAYQPVLSVLKKLDEKNFPMRQYIIDTKTTNALPKHYKDKTSLDISNLKVDLYDDSTWPTPKDLSFNASQYAAFKFALTNKFTVIQGPPGTGKTFMALKITEVLLNNITDSSPILVICYTNHALDQFLEGVLNNTQNVIRIGGQSKNEVLQDYNLKNLILKKQLNKYSYFSKEFRKKVFHKHTLQKLIKALDNQISRLNSNNVILNFSLLEPVMSPEHRDQLLGSKREYEWLLDPYMVAPVEERLDNGTLNEEFFVEDPSEETSAEKSPVEETLEDTTLDIVEHENTSELDEQDTFQLSANADDNNLCDEDETDDENFANTTEVLIKRADENLIYETEDMLEILMRYEYEYTIPDLRREIDRCKYKMMVYRYPSVRERKAFIKSMTNRCNTFSYLIDLILIMFRRYKVYKYNVEEFNMFEKKMDVWELSIHNRWKYYFSWIQLYEGKLRQRMQLLTERCLSLEQEIQELGQLKGLEFIKQAKVIGMTTSGAAKRRVLLEHLNIKTAIVEEAAEVLEAHIVTALTKSIEQLILIGDHKQLRPSVSEYNLAKNYRLDVSLFERMLNNGVQCCLLDVQHRMRPEIASLIVPTIYPTLNNHPSTADRPKITGLDKFLFFINHKTFEDEIVDSKSHQNRHEADFLLALCRHLLLQGYKPNEITILATYLGQVWYLQKARTRLAIDMRELKEVRITSVDNYQGEEARIILLSLVRSNKDNKIGFLSAENRVCVALSRARDGLYIMGNLDCLVVNSSIWSQVRDCLLENNAVGDQLVLRCERHPDQIILASRAEDFSKSPRGGCTKPCQSDLSCGHVCPQICHIIDKDHGFFRCQEPCPRIPCHEKGYNHKCPLLCHEPCQPCRVLVNKTLRCTHEAELACHVEPASHTCSVVVSVILPCGHSTTKLCHEDIESSSCKEQCENRLPCGHSCKQKCHINDDPDHVKYQCQKKCDRVMCERDHLCPKACYKPCGKCRVPVEMELPCGHWTKEPCWKDINSIRCSQKCAKTLPCGHPCPRSCWQPCEPSLCQVKVEKLGPCGHPLYGVECGTPTEDLSEMCPAWCGQPLPCGHDCRERCRPVCSQAPCRVLVPCPVIPACGDGPVSIKCHLNHPGLEPSSHELLQLCEAPCNTMLDCGHFCSGDCSSCLQGHLHVPCDQPCNKLLYCGHRCQAACKDLCPPCNQDYFSICNHQRFVQKCSEPRDRCNAPCDWRCSHLMCTKLCGEVCNRRICRLPCYYRLPCSHWCLGFCGEIHPALCRFCDSNDILIQENPTAKFVVLEDCGHIIASDRLDAIMFSATCGFVMALMVCPECQTPILRTNYCRRQSLHYRNQQARMTKALGDQFYQLRKISYHGAQLLGSSPTISDKMNSLMSDCSGALSVQYQPGRLLLGALLLPLALTCLHPLSYDEDTKNLIKKRLDRVALALRRRIRSISYHDVIQIEAEVANIRSTLSKYLEGEEIIGPKQLYNLSATLRTRDAARQWQRCRMNHFFINGFNKEECTTCSFENGNLLRVSLSLISNSPSSPTYSPPSPVVTIASNYYSKYTD